MIYLLAFLWCLGACWSTRSLIAEQGKETTALDLVCIIVIVLLWPVFVVARGLR